ncbi:rhomboid family intramembrane serine protease [Microbacteriaceae bacterium 4G12]
MPNKQDSLYWSLLYTFVSLHRYEFLYFSEDHQEAWLESTHLQDNTIIRLRRADVDWARSVRNDLLQIQPVIEQITKRRLRKKVTIYNVYISSAEPVDDWRELIEEVQGVVPSETIFFTEENEQQQKAFFQQAFRLSDQESESVFALQKEEPEVLRYRLAQVMTMRQQQQEQIVNYAKPIFTKLFVVTQIIMFALLQWYGGSTNTETLIRFGAKYNPLILQGEWWRFITPIFLHIGFLHLLMNTVALYYIGNQVERIVGNVRFIIIYLFAGISGSVLSFVLSSSVAAGSSGAIFGCFGALVYIALTHSKLFSKSVMQSVLTLIGVNLIFGFVMPGIDNAGHIGGLVGGFLAAAVVHVPKQKSSLAKRIGALITALALVGGLLFYGFHTYANDPQMLMYEARDALNHHNTKEAEVLLNKAVQKSNAPLEAHYLLGYIYGMENNSQKAIEELNFVLAKKPDHDQAHYLLALVYLQEKRVAEATEHAKQAVRLQPENEKYKELLDQLNVMQKQL